jgi:hypothetical protein
MRQCTASQRSKTLMPRKKPPELTLQDHVAKFLVDVHHYASWNRPSSPTSTISSPKTSSGPSSNVRPQQLFRNDFELDRRQNVHGKAAGIGRRWSGLGSRSFSQHVNDDITHEAGFYFCIDDNFDLHAIGRR